MNAQRHAPSTKFQLASNSKFMIGVVIGTPVDAQRTTWDQPVKEHYPALESGGTR